MTRPLIIAALWAIAAFVTWAIVHVGSRDDPPEWDESTTPGTFWIDRPYSRLACAEDVVDFRLGTPEQQDAAAAWLADRAGA